ncbi:MAG: hypothetical protein FWD01_00985 [Defluviitaleaceae bacterium]|nr:hypothetical protein [Defluviitaleaceae bacterium]
MKFSLVFFAVFSIFAATLLTSCDTTENETIDIYQHGANQYIQSMIEEIERIPNVNIINTRINSFEKIANFDHITPKLSYEFWQLDFPNLREFELWELDFELQDENTGSVRWGTFTADSDGWVGQRTAWNDARIILIFLRGETDENGEAEIRFMGHIPWHYGLNVGTGTTWGQETVLRMHLEELGIISDITFPGNHYTAYFEFSSIDLHPLFRMMLSQPFEQGEGGIWVVERWQQLGHSEEVWNWDNYHLYYGIPIIAGEIRTDMHMLEYAEELQRLFEAGEADWLTDVNAVAQAFLRGNGFREDYAQIIGVFQIPYYEKPFDRIRVVTRKQHAERLFRTFRVMDDEENIALRAQILEEIGGLDFWEAYHFEMESNYERDYGLDTFGLITGWRPLTSREELNRYFPQLDLPETIGDFVLRRITVENMGLGSWSLFDYLGINYGYIEPWLYGRGISLHGWDENQAGVNIPREALMNEVFELFGGLVRPAFAFHALYENSEGVYVGLGVSSAIMAFNAERWIIQGVPLSAWDAEEAEEFGEVYFMGDETDGYFFASHHVDEALIMISLSFRDDPENLSYDRIWEDLFFWGSYDSDMMPVEREALEELIRIFNPAALYQEFQWSLEPR